MSADLVIKRNDLLPSLVIVCRDSVGPVDLAGATALFRMVNVLNASVKVNASASVITDPAFTANATTNVLTSNSHGLNNGDDVTLKSSGTLPSGLDTQTRYYVINATTNALQLSTVQNGSAVDIGDTGSGAHTLLAGKVRYDWDTGASGETNTAGTYFGEVQTTINGKTLTYPNHRNLLIEVTSDLV